MTRSPKSKHLVCLPGGNKTPKRSSFPIPKPPEAAIANQDTFAVDLQQLEGQARRINQLSAELEAAIAEFKETGDRVDINSVHFREELGHYWFPDRICSYGEIKIPQIRQKGNGALILSSHRVDLFAAQREAHFLAHLLRQRNLAKQ
ncbi:hypothetical protein [Spirulina sp. 06S082]|uniref:hypothetical protein n=1 Tax=Spirulina sp. 06S082 TaxID=3110248 RepID=UPI002B21DF0E|nr:hypothetical protein [Spirulina sp. 06S082]MEA5467407.1 hypothetical protein [Spirulina sp. 06S082]